MERIFVYGTRETDALRAADPVLGAAIDRIGPLHRTVIDDLFAALVNSIAGQQISGKALATVWARLTAQMRPMTPAAVIALPEGALHACGLSGRKEEYIRAAAQAVLSGALDLDALQCLPDEDVIARLTTLSGVGRWTAEMLLIFSMQRPDVLAFDDFGIRRGLCLLYGLPEITKTAFAQYRARYAPYATVAGLYLWEIAARGNKG